MNLGKVIYYLGSLFIGLFFIFIGMAGVMIPWYPGFRIKLIRFILDNDLLITLFSVSILLIGVGLVIYAMTSIRHRTYKYRGGNHSISVDELVIQQYLDTYWEKLFPKNEIPSRLMIKRNKVHIYADLPHFPKQEQKDLILQIDRDLSELFTKIFGYTHEFVLNISFRE